MGTVAPGWTKATVPSPRYRGRRLRLLIGMSWCAVRRASSDGLPEEEVDREKEEKQHEARYREFCWAFHEVTPEEVQGVMGYNTSYLKDGKEAPLG